jgi:hypothetical protein
MLKKALSIMTAVATVISTSVAAHAFTITNLDGTAQMLTILEQADEWDIAIQPNETLSHLCHSGCLIILEYDEDQDFQGNETVEIKDGRMNVTK